MRFKIENEIVMLEIQNEEDLWYLSLVINEGDTIVSDVFRRTERKSDSIRNKKTEREKMSIKLKVETIEFLELSQRIHVVGVIVDGPEEVIGEHQSINIENETILRIIPANTETFIKRIEESLAFNSVAVPVLSVDDKTISLYSVNESNDEIVWKIDSGEGKMYEGKEEDHRQELLGLLEKYKKSTIYVIGPSIFRDSISKFLSQNKFSAINTDVSASEEEGIRELLQSGTVNLRRSEESKLVAEFLKKLNSELATYGTAKVNEALDLKAVSVLLITDKFFRERRSSTFLQKCELGGCRAFVVHGSWETGRMINSFGGIAALLRYRLPQ